MREHMRQLEHHLEKLDADLLDATAPTLDYDCMLGKYVNVVTQFIPRSLQKTSRINK